MAWRGAGGKLLPNAGDAFLFRIRPALYSFCWTRAAWAAIDELGHAAGLRDRDLAGPYRDW